jgi:hypothetical protein
MLKTMSHRWYIVLALVVVAAILASPVNAGISGAGVSGVQVQNLTSTQGSVLVSLYPQSGGAAIPLPQVTVKGEAAANFYLPSISSVTAGSYAMVVGATMNVGAIARTDWASTGGAAIYSSVAPGTSVLVPLVLSGFAGQTSQVSVQNTDTSNAVTDVKLTLYGRGSATIVKQLTNQTIQKGTSKTWALNDTGVWGSLPNTALDLGAPGFVGLLVVESAKPLVVQTFIDIAGTPGVTGFTGVPSTSAATKLYCPLVRANFYGDTGISIVNNNGAATNVAITFRADPASPNQGTFNQTLAIGANSSNIAFQGPGGNSRSAPTNLPGGTQTTGNTNLTNNGFFGSAVLDSPQPIVAVVNDTQFGGGFSVKGQSTYNCVPVTDAGKTHFLPLLRKFHLSNTKLTTGVQVLNVTGSAGSATLSLVNFDGNALPNPITKPFGANGAANFFGGDWPNLPTVPPALGGSGWYGSGKITCTQDCVVIVSDEGFGATAVDRANYVGIKGG